MKTCKCKKKFEPILQMGMPVSKFCEPCRKKKERLKKRKQIERQKLARKKKRENNIPRLKRKADKLFSIAVRLRDGKCLRTGRTENLQCSHIWSRSNNFIRWDLDNALTLTAGQHLYWWHKEPAEAVIWAKDLLGDEKWEELLQKKNKPFKLTPQFIKERIKFLEDYIG